MLLGLPWNCGYLMKLLVQSNAFNIHWFNTLVNWSSYIYLNSRFHTYWHHFDKLNILQLPKGTHEWSSFLTLEELVLILQRANITVSKKCLWILMFHEYLPHVLALLTSAHFSKACLLSDWLFAGQGNGWICLQPLDWKMVSIWWY